MNRMILAAVIVIIVLVFGIGLGWWLNSDRAMTKVSSELILTALHDRGFLVTQTYIFNEPLTIESTEEEFWKDFLWGQEVKAHGVIEVNMGVDLGEISENDVAIRDDKIYVTIPPAQLFNTRLIGQINVENKQGILKRLFDNDDGYNQALSELTKQAEEAAKDPELLARANERAVEEIERLLGYVVGDKEIVVEIEQ